MPGLPRVPASFVFAVLCVGCGGGGASGSETQSRVQLSHDADFNGDSSPLVAIPTSGTSGVDTRVYVRAGLRTLQLRLPATALATGQSFTVAQGASAVYDEDETSFWKVLAGKVSVVSVAGGRATLQIGQLVFAPSAFEGNTAKGACTMDGRLTEIRLDPGDAL